MGERLNRHITKDTLMANEHMKRCSASLVIIETKSKHNEISLFAHQNAGIQKTDKTPSTRDDRNEKIQTFLMGM